MTGMTHKQGATFGPPYCFTNAIRGGRQLVWPRPTSMRAIHHRRSYDKERARMRKEHAYHRARPWRFQAITLDRVAVPVLRQGLFGK